MKMADLPGFKRGQIVGDRIAKTAELFGVGKSNVSKVITAFEKEGKTSPLKAKLWKKARAVWSGPSDSYE